MKKILVLAITASLFLFSCSKEEAVIKKYYKTTVVQSGSITDSESFVGYTDSFNTVALAPKVGGKIVSITKNVGDKVEVGEVIVILDSTEAKTGYASSNEIIKNLEKLKISTSQMYDSQIAVMEQKINQANTQIDIAKIGVLGAETGIIDTQNTIDSQIKTIDSQIKTAETSLQTAKLNLENAKNSLNQKEIDIYNNSKNAITNANILATNMLDFLDNLFGITPANRYKKENYDSYLSAKNTSLKNEIETEFNLISSKLNELKNLPLDTNENIKTALEKYNEVFGNDIRSILKKSYLAMTNSVESSNFSKNFIDFNKNQISSFQSQNEQVILNVSGNYFLGLKGSLDSINNFEKEKKSNLDLLEKQVELAQSQIDTLLKTKEQITSAGSGQINDIGTKSQIAKKQEIQSQNALKEALSQLESLKKQKEASLAQIDAQIEQVKSGKNEAYVMIENGKVTSLIKGVVTKKLSEVGSVIGAGMPILMVSNDRNIKIEIQIPEDVLKKVKLLDKVKVEIDGLSEQKDGVITKIFPTRDPITKRTTIELTLNNEKNDIKIGSYSKVFLNIGKNDDSIIIPNSAILSKYMIPQVFVLENGVAKLRDIQTIKQNDNFSQVVGVNVGEVIITEGKENIYDGEILK